MRNKSTFLLLLILFFVFGLLELIYPYYFLFDDNATQFLPFYVFNWRSVVEQGYLPQINFFQLLGYDYLGASQTAVFYIPIYIASAISLLLTSQLYATIEIVVIGHLIMSGLGLWFLFKTQKVPTHIAIAGVSVWLTQPFVVSMSRSWAHASYLCSVLPWYFLLLSNEDKHHNWTRTQAIKILLKSSLLYGGYAQWMVMLQLYETLYYFFKKLKRLPVDYIGYVVTTISTVVLSLPVLIPLYQTLQLSEYRSQPLTSDQALDFSLNIPIWILSQFGVFQANYFFEASSALVSGVFLLIIITLVGKIKNIQVHGNGLMGLIFISFLLSTHANLILVLLPIFDRFRYPLKHYFFFVFFILMYSVLVISKIKSNKIKYGAIGLLLITNLLILSSQDKNLLLSQLSFDRDWAGEFEFDPHYRVAPQGPVENTSSQAILTSNFATLYQITALNGYDPLISSFAYSAALGLNHQQALPFPVSESVVEHLQEHSVRYILSHDKKGKLHYQTIDKAKPIVGYFDEGEVESIDFTYYQNSIVFNVPPPGSVVEIRINPLLEYDVYFDDQWQYSTTSEFPLKIPVESIFAKAEVRYTTPLLKVLDHSRGR